MDMLADWTHKLYNSMSTEYNILTIKLFFIYTQIEYWTSSHSQFKKFYL